MTDITKQTMSRRGMVAAGGALALALGLSWRGLAHEGHDHGDGTPGAGTPHAHDDDHGHGHDASTGVAAVYLTITNNGDEADTLIGGETEVANIVEVHTMTMEGDVMRMAMLPDGLEIPAGETVSLEPGAEHIMLIGLTQDVRPNSEFAITLHFERAGEVEVISRTRMTPELPDGAEETEPITAGDLELTDVWSRPAPMITAAAGTPAAGGHPEATPAS